MNHKICHICKNIEKGVYTVPKEEIVEIDLKNGKPIKISNVKVFVCKNCMSERRMDDDEAI